MFELTYDDRLGVDAYLDGMNPPSSAASRVSTSKEDYLRKIFDADRYLKSRTKKSRGGGCGGGGFSTDLDMMNRNDDNDIDLLENDSEYPPRVDTNDRRREHQNAAFAATAASITPMTQMQPLYGVGNAATGTVRFSTFKYKPNNKASNGNDPRDLQESYNPSSTVLPAPIGDCSSKGGINKLSATEKNRFLKKIRDAEKRIKSKHNKNDVALMCSDYTVL